MLPQSPHESALRDTVVIDCGHIPVHYHNGQLFGATHHTPTSIMRTLEHGIALKKRLEQQNKVASLHICLTDTQRYLPDPSYRTQLKEWIREKHTHFLLPKEFLHCLEKHCISTENLTITLQSVNSNRFSNVIKKAKKQTKRSRTADIDISYNCTFLTDAEKFCFLFTSPFLLHTEHIDTTLGGDWWKLPHVELTPQDVYQCPDIRIKKLGVVKLYDKNKGILCPATYGGLLEDYDDTTDHVAIYSRADDPFIGEKIIRGIIAKETLSPATHKNYLQFIYNPDISAYEESFYSSSMFATPQEDDSYSTQVNTLMDSHHYQPYV